MGFIGTADGKVALYTVKVVVPTAANTALSQTRIELFVDNYFVQQLSGVAQSVNAPTKYGSNPVFVSGANSDTWDYDKYYVHVHLEDTTYKMWYGCHEDDSPYANYTCYATSSDGQTWSKGNLGLVTYEGDTNNNIILDTDYYGAGILYDEEASADMRYLIVTGQSPTEATDGVFLLKSSDGINFTLIKTIHADTNFIGHDIVKLSDGTYVAYYQGFASSLRHIGAFTSDTTDPTGDWTDRGKIISSSGSSDQRYIMGTQTDGETIFGFVTKYIESSELGPQIDLYVSHNGLNFNQIYSAWLPAGAATTWDDSIVWPGNSLTHTGNDWRYYYSGVPVAHSVQAGTRDARIGYATLGYRRIGQVGTTGTVTTKAIQPQGGKTLHINADASGGTLDVQLLDAGDDTVITGFATADFDQITSDTYDTTGQWGGVDIPGLRVKLQFTLSSATLYSYWIE